MSCHLSRRFFERYQESSENVDDVLFLAEWVKENTEPDDLIYVDPPQLFVFLTDRQTIGASRAALFVEMVDKKYKPDYFIISDYRSSLSYYRAGKFIIENYDVIVFNPDARYIIFKSKEEEI